MVTSNYSCASTASSELPVYRIAFSVLHFPYVILPFFALWFISKHVRERTTGMKGLDVLERKYREHSGSIDGYSSGSGMGGTLVRSARGTALKKFTSARWSRNLSGSGKYRFPSDILTEPRNEKMVKLGINVPYISSSRVIDLQLAARALEDATACTQKPSTQRLKVRTLLG